MVPKRSWRYPRPVPDVIIVSDSAPLRAEVRSALAEGATVHELTRGAQLLPAVREYLPDLVVVDLQVGKMGGMAATLDVRLEEGAGRLPHVPVLMLLDRRPDVFLARRSEADGWLVKPLDALRIAAAVSSILDGGTYHDPSYEPLTVPIDGGTRTTVG